jgi:hypothetical protein
MGLHLCLHIQARLQPFSCLVDLGHLLELTIFLYAGLIDA